MNGENLKIKSLPPDFNVEDRAKMAMENFRQHGYNCCQAVLLAYSDIIGIGPETAAVIASGFGGGMGRLREVCGSVSAMFMIAGFIHPAADPSIKADRTANYSLVQELAAKFREQNGSIVCKELLGLVPKSPDVKNGASMPAGNTGEQAIESPEPSDRTPEYYRKRPCEELVGISARIIGNRIAEQFSKTGSRAMPE